MDDSKKSAGGFDRMELWKEYENVAMHFNDLIIRLRSQSLGAVAAFATLAGVITKSDTNVQMRWWLLTGAFSLLAFFWIAVWILDLGYYNRLLAGAVDALLSLESNSMGSDKVDRIDLSTKVENGVASGGVRHNGYRIAFYGVVLATLLAGAALGGSTTHWNKLMPNVDGGAALRSC